MRRVSYGYFLFFIVLTLLTAITSSAFAAVRVASFDEFAAGDLITTELECTHGVVFPFGVEVFLDPTSGFGNKSIRPLVIDEFQRQRLILDFTAPLDVISLQVGNAESAPSTSEVVITMTAYTTIMITDPLGRTFPVQVVVDSDSARINGADRVSRPTLNANGDANGIDRIIVESRLEGGVRDNLNLFADWIVMQTEQPLPPCEEDTTPPTIVFAGTLIDYHVDIESNSLLYGLIVRDNRELDTVTQTIENLDTLETIVTPLCGVSPSPICPPTELNRTVSVEFDGEGDYRYTVRACDTAGLCDEGTRSVTVDFPDIPTVSVFPWKIEMNQAVQSRLADATGPGMGNSESFNEPIVPGKDTVVRWYLLGVEGSRENFTADMRVFVEYDDDTEKSFKMRPNAGIPTITVPVNPGTDFERWKLINGAMRADPTKTLNFVIPRRDLVGASYIRLQLEGVSGVTRIDIKEPIVLGLNIFRVYGGRPGSPPTDSEIDSAILPYLRKALPVSAIFDLNRRTFRWAGPYFFLGDCDSLLYDMWTAYGGDDVLGRLSGPGTFTSNMAVVRSLSDCSGIAHLGDPDDGDYRYGSVAVTMLFGDVAAHEIGHNVGFPHASNSHGEGDGGDYEPWFFPHGLVGGMEFGAIPVNVTVPGEFDRGQWTINMLDPCPNASAADLSDRYPFCTAMVDVDGDGTPDDKTRAHDLMSYGFSPTSLSPLVTSGARKWVSGITYSRFYSAIHSGVISPAIRSASAVSADAPPEERVEAFVVGGVIQDDGSIVLMPLTRKPVPPTMVSTASTGRYILRLVDIGGAILREVPFDPTEASDSGRNHVKLIVPYVEGVARLEILDNGQLVAETSASPNPPQVRILEPNGGEILPSGVHTVRWEAFDPDGDLLTFLLQFTPDGGKSWQGIGFVREDGVRELTFDTNELIPGRKGKIRITASDGFHTSVDMSDHAFTVGTDELPIDLVKTLLSGPAQIGISLTTPTTYVFKISYANPDQNTKVLIKDTVPAEFDIVDASASTGDVQFFKTAKFEKGKQNSANRIEWDLDTNEKEGILSVEIKTSLNPGKGHQPPVYKPTSCGSLKINDGATAYEIDPATGKIRYIDVQDPVTNFVSSQPVIVMGPSNSIGVTAVGGANPCFP